MTRRSKRLPNGARVHVRSAHFPEECDAVVREAVYDAGWLYRVDVTRGKKPRDATHQDGSVWVWDFELRPLQ